MQDIIETNEELEQSLIKINGLSWMPWMGNDFGNASTKEKILFVGESHYINKQEDEHYYLHKSITRRIVKDMAIDGNSYGSPFFENIHRMIFSSSNLTQDQRENFWANISFYNFVQTPMNTKKGRPGKTEFEEGWRVFYQLIAIMKPTACIFLGVTAGNYYKIGSKHKHQFSLTDYKWGDVWFGRSRSIYLQLRQPNEESVELYFVKHPSSFFSPEKSREFLRYKNNGMMKYLKGLDKIDADFQDVRLLLIPSLT